MIRFYWLDYTYYDHPGKYSLVLYCGWCNLRCYGCHNRQIAGWDYDNLETKTNKLKVDVDSVANKLHDEETKLAIQNEMLDMVILCWGEILINSVQDVLETIDYIKSLNPNVLIRVDTNWTFPEKVKELAESWKVDWFAIDIKGPYWDEKFHDTSSDVIWWPREVAQKLFPKMIESLNISKELPYTVYRTVLYPIASQDYFNEIKTYVSKNLKKYHHFSQYVSL